VRHVGLALIRAWAASDTALVRRLPVTTALLALAALACSDAQPADGAPAQPAALERIQPGPHDVAVIDLGELGAIRIELLPELAPRSVESFASLAEQGYYDGTTFHRVIPGFMIQGGDALSKNNDPRDDGRGNDHKVPDEFSDYPHLRGTVSLANSGSRNSSGSQFFIVHEDQRGLDGSYTVFGRVVSGIETVDAVTRLEIDKYGRFGPRDRPYPKSAVMRSVRIERASASPAGAVNPAPATAAAR
jgi:peptidyl-prolyl cis-trans isomerase B (cyclophilin B)